MTLLRYGRNGHEIPGIPDNNGHIHDLSGEVRDISEEVLASVIAGSVETSGRERSSFVCGRAAHRSVRRTSRKIHLHRT